MKNQMLIFLKKPLSYVVLVLLLLLAFLFIHRYEGEAITGYVVDAETKKPLESVVIISLWELRVGLGHQKTVGYVWVDEVITNASGQYRFPAWGPLTVWFHFMGNYSPQLILFKQGYRYKRINNGVGKPTPNRRVWSSSWNGKTIELEKFAGSIYEYKDHLGSLDIKINQLRDGNDCEWKKIPYFLIEIQKTEEYLKKTTDNIGTRPLDAPTVTMDFVHYADRVWNQKKCGSAKEFFEGYLNEK